MNISIRNRAIRTIVAASALGVAFTGGVVTGRAADATPQAPVSAVRSEQAATQRVFQIVDSRQAAVEAERAAYVTAQERVLVGITASEPDLQVIDDSPAGRMTAMEAVLVATGGQ